MSKSSDILVRCDETVDLCSVGRGKRIADASNSIYVREAEVCRNGDTVLSGSGEDIQSQDYYIAMVRKCCEIESRKESNDLMMRYHQKMSESVHYSLILLALQSWVWVTGCWSGVACRGRGPR